MQTQNYFLPFVMPLAVEVAMAKAMAVATGAKRQKHFSSDRGKGKSISLFNWQ